MDAKSFFNAAELAKIESKKDSLNALTDGKGEKKVKQMIDASGAMKALDEGNIDGLKAAMQGILSSDEGERFFQSLSELMK